MIPPDRQILPRPDRFLSPAAYRALLEAAEDAGRGLYVIPVATDRRATR